jgi:hypothetical protein
MILRDLSTGTYPRRGRSESCSFWHDPSSCSFPRTDKKKKRDLGYNLTPLLISPGVLAAIATPEVCS